MLFRVITWLIVIGFVYRFLSRYIFPVVRMTSTNDRLREMQDQMREMQRKMEENNTRSSKRRVKKDGDYIDYEEVR